MVIQVLHFLLCIPLDFLLLYPPKWGSTGPTVVDYALRKWLIPIFPKTTKISNAQIYTDISPEGLCIFSGYDVISYFQSVANRVHATATVADFTVAKQSFLKILENC